MPDQPSLRPAGVHLISTDPWSKEWGQPPRSAHPHWKYLISRVSTHLGLGKQLSFISRIESGVENTHYHVRTELGQYVLRIYEDKKADQIDSILEEISLIEFLSSNGFPTPRIIGEHVVEEDFCVLVFEYIEGKCPDISSTESVVAMGRLLASFHNLSARCVLALKREELSKYPRTLSSATTLIDQLIAANSSLGILGDRTLSWLIARCQTVFERKFALALPKRVIHNDFHRENIICAVSGMYLIDFDDIEEDYFIQDIGRAINHFHKYKDSVSLSKVSHFLEGYVSARDLSSKEKKSISLIIEYNFLIQTVRNVLAAYAQRIEDCSFVPASLALLQDYSACRREVVDIAESMG